MNAIRQNQVALVLEYINGRKLVATNHGLGVIGAGLFVKAHTGYRTKWAIIT